MTKCIVPGCNSKYMKNLAPGEKRITLFFARTEDQIQRWSKAIQNLGIEIKKRSCICELHFEEKFINRHFPNVVLKDGTVWKMERERTRLRKDAVPTIFTKQGNPQKRANVANDVVRFDSMLEVARKSIISSDNIRTDSMLEVSDDNIRTDSMLEVSNAPSVIKQAKITEPFSFNVLVNYLHFVKTPNEYWGVTVHKSQVLCAKWAHDFMLEKRVIVNKDLSVQVFLRNRKVELQMDKIKSIEDLSSFLEQIHILEVCMNIDSGDGSGCTMFVTRKIKRYDSKYCDNCLLNRKKKYDPQKKVKEMANALEKARMKNRILAEKFVSVNRKFARLKNKVARLQEKVKNQPKSEKSVLKQKWNDSDAEEMNELNAIINFEVNECSDGEVMKVEEQSNGNEFSTMSYADE